MEEIPSNYRRLIRLVLNIKLNSFLQILIIILAGEAIFLLPFVLARVFRPTFLDVFQISNTELGSCFSIYGIVALISYLLGGFIADKFAPSKLMAVALFLTGLGGLYLATIPDLSGLQLVYGCLLYTSPSPRDGLLSRMPSSA